MLLSIPIVRRLIPLVLLPVVLATIPAAGQICNLKVVTDASPDYSDMESMVRSITARWPTPAEKCWAMFYWNHIARRQTSPMILHGSELTDPIRQFNDYGYTMCSTIAGINCAIWKNMGLEVKFWDISLHTVPECFYGGRWHMYDDSMSAVYTLCDGVTIAGVEDIGKEGACAASRGRSEPGHIARYHCLNATSANGFLTGADTPRDLAQEYRCFKPSGLKHRYYYHNAEWGHRYVLNLQPGESYLRHYRSLGDEPAFYVPNQGKDPESVNRRYHIRGNGVWTFKPSLTPAEYESSLLHGENVQAIAKGGLGPVRTGAEAQAVFKVQSANVATSQTISARCFRRTPGDSVRLALSTTNGLQWKEIWSAEGTGEQVAKLELLEEVSGAYEILVRVILRAQGSPSDARLEDLQIETRTMLNSKTQPQLRLGKNIVYVGQGEQTDSIVVFPELQDGKYKPYVVEESNVATLPEHRGYQGAMFAQRPNEDAYVVYRIDAPRDITRVTQGGRFYNRARGAQIHLAHSFDGGKTWTNSYSLKSTEPPWDVTHYETITAVPPGTRSVLCKYAFRASQAGADACSLYSVRMEVNHRPREVTSRPLEVTFDWSEVRPDRTLARRSHTQRMERAPKRYEIHVGGADHPVMNSLRIGFAGEGPLKPSGYSDGTDVGGARHQDRWVTHGPNLFEGKPYTLSVPPTGQWGGDDPQVTKLTDGIVGPPYAGGIAPRFAALWNPGPNDPLITVDLGQPESMAVFRIHLTAGWPWWDALRGEVRDDVEVFSSRDGEQFQSHGKFDLNLWRKDIPLNHLLPDEETAKAWNYELVLEEPVTARFVRYKITPRRSVGVSEVQALKSVRYEPFDMRIALPDD